MRQTVASIPSWARAERERLLRAAPVAIVILLMLVAIFSAMIWIDSEARFGVETVRVEPAHHL